ncbi:MAG: hypothetical protein OXU68_10900 [Bacteroidota bacterium]|nr:hypothetical protein [Bacteroidota bacterium]
MDRALSVSGAAGTAPPALMPLVRGLQGDDGFETLEDYEDSVRINTLPAGMENPYVITRELDSTPTIPGSRDGTIRGYEVQVAVADLKWSKK